MSKIVKYAVHYEEHSLTDAEYLLIRHLYENGERVAAIKFIRGQYNLCLKPAKDICDAVHAVRE